MKTITHPASKCVLALRNSTLLFGLILLICTSVFGEEPPEQQWVALYNGPGNGTDNATALKIDNLGNVYVMGWSTGSGTGSDYATVKYSPDGNQLWVARYNGPGNSSDSAQALAVDNSGNVYVTGWSTGSGTGSDYATIKHNPDGNQLWVARYNGLANINEEARSLSVDNSGNVYVTGYSYGSGTDQDYATVKYTPDGNELWVARYNGDANNYDSAYALAVDNSGNVYVTGRSYGGSGTSYDYATVKYSPDGNQLWVRRYNGPVIYSQDGAKALAVDNSGNVYVTGSSDGNGTGSDYATVKYDSNGNQLWVARYNGPANNGEVAQALAVDSSGNVYVTGGSYGSGAADSDYATVKYNSDGNQLWAARYNGPADSNDAAYGLAVDNSGNVYVTGNSPGSGTYDDYATVKYSPDGNQLWVARYNGPGNSYDAAYGLAVNNSGYVYVTGPSYVSGGTGYDYTTIKYTQPYYNCIYVDANATGANNGSSWANAYNYLQDALDVATSGYEIWVAQGTYRPDRDTNHPGGTNDRTATFQLINNVAIYGGFPSGGGQWASRDPNIYETILSGDIGVANDINDNSYNVVTGSGTDSAAVLDGFTITAGNAVSGGGMLNSHGSPTVTNCTFSGNTSSNVGGGMYNDHSSPILTNCTFSGNSTSGWGGGMRNNNSSPTVTNCTFIGNSASTNGGGMHNVNSSNPTVTNCTFTGNSTSGGGGGMWNNSSSPTVTNCTFTGNSAHSNGGGMYGYNSSSPTVTNCTFIGNDANNGGGMCVESDCNMTLTDCNFSGNSARQFGGGIYAISNSVTNVKAGGSISIVDEFYISENSQIRGIGRVVIGLGGEMVVDANAVVDLNDPNYPNVTGKIQCDGLLQVKGSARLSHATLQVTRQAGGFFGKFRVENLAQVQDVNIYTDGDRFMDVDPCTFTGLIANNHIYVTITEGQNETPEGMLEVRGRDLNESHCDFNEPNVLACHLDSNAMPSFDTNSWTLERLTVTAGAKVSLVDRFSSGNGDPEVLYVKNLVLGSGCVLNVGLEHLYYTNCTGDPNSIKKGAILGFSLDDMDCDSNEEFESRVGNNNFTHPTDPNYNRAYTERVVGDPDPNGMMRMRNLEDPCSGQIIFARAKGEFAPVVEDRIRIRFNYLFTTTDPCTQIVVYLSDVPELQGTRDPNHYIEVARISAPPVPRPGSAGSGRFGNFEKYVSTGWLDLSKGTWIELELIEPVQGPLFGRGGYEPMWAADSGGGAIVYVNDWNPGVDCCWLGYDCLDLNGSLTITEADFLIVVGGAGRSGIPPCLEGVFSRDGCSDAYDTVSWDWAMNDIQARGPLCAEDGYMEVPLSMTEGMYGGGMSGLSGYLGSQLTLLDISDLNDLLIVGKRGTTNAQTKLKDRLYVFDSNAHYVQWFEPEPNRCNIRIVRGVGDDLYQINSENGVLRLDDHTQVVPPGETNCPNEPRYNRPATVYVGVHENGNTFGRPILDAAFDTNFVYVVPVVVAPEGNEPYTAAAKLALDQSSPPYHVVKLYDEPPLVGDNQRECRNTLREIELDAAGNVYVTNANNKNESDILWKFEPNGTVRRLDLDRVDPANEPYYAPTGMCISIATNVLYLASSIYNKTDPNSAVIRGFSTGTLAPVRTIMVSKMQHVTSITENPLTHSLWITGFCFNSMPDSPDAGALPFYDPYLAWVPLGVNNVSAVCILDANDPNNDLAMPLSIVWTGARPAQELCGGADLDGSGRVDMPDFAWLARYWRNTNCAAPNNYCEGADLEPEANPDGDVDLKDLEILAEHWLDAGC